MTNLLAQINIAPPGGFQGPAGGTLSNPGTNAINLFSGVISTSIGIMTLVAFIWFLYLFFIGAIGIMTAGGDKQKLEGARTRIANGIIGLVVVILAVSLISLLGFLFNIDILNIPKLFSQLTGGASSGGGGTTFKR